MHRTSCVSAAGTPEGKNQGAIESATSMPTRGSAAETEMDARAHR
jgi:hypothetical protein